MRPRLKTRTEMQKHWLRGVNAGYQLFKVGKDPVKELHAAKTTQQLLALKQVR